MVRYLFVFCLAVSLWGCGEPFTSGNPSDAGPGGTGGNTGGSAGQGGNTGGSAGTGGNTGGSAGQGGNTGGSAGQGGTGGSNPCPDITYNAAATLLGDDCGNLFASGCGTSNPVPRSDFISAVILQVQAPKQAGYLDPPAPSFSDVALAHPAFTAIEKALWLELVPVTNFFHPDDPTTTCFAQDVVTAMGNLPDMYAVVFWQAGSGNMGSGAGPVTVTRFYVHGTSPGSHLTTLLSVVNNLTADFTVPQDTTALEAVGLRCEVPTGGSFFPYPLPLTAGKADFTALDCYKQDSSPLELLLQMDASPGGVGAQARIGIDPATLVIRRGAGGTQADAPIKTIN